MVRLLFTLVHVFSFFDVCSAVIFFFDLRNLRRMLVVSSGDSSLSEAVRVEVREEMGKWPSHVHRHTLAPKFQQ